MKWVDQFVKRKRPERSAIVQIWNEEDINPEIDDLEEETTPLKSIEEAVQMHDQ